MHNKNSAMAFIVLLGIVSLFSDMTHEAATSIKGAYLLILGASASTIGFISGIGELLGYGLRYLFGRLVDKTHNYWGFMILGYAVDVFAVPALALVHRDGWIAACVLLVVERIGKAIKSLQRILFFPLQLRRRVSAKALLYRKPWISLALLSAPCCLCGDAV